MARLIEDGIERTIAQKRVTYDLERLMEGAKKLRTSEFARRIIENMQRRRRRRISVEQRQPVEDPLGSAASHTLAIDTRCLEP